MKQAPLILFMLFSACVGTPVRDTIPALLIGREVVYAPPDLPPDIPADRQTWAADGTTVYDRRTGPFKNALHG